MRVRRSARVGTTCLATLLAAGMAMLGAGFGPAPGTPAAAADAPPERDPVAEAVAHAAAQAAATGVPVLVEELTDPHTQHRANPDGTVTFEQFATVQRVRRGSNWVPVDTTLRLDGGRVVPGATALDLSLSAGGTDELVVLRAGAARLGLSWPDPLPAPELSGSTATYPEVLPGLDLRVTAEPESFRQVLVVKTRAAATSPALTRIAWRVSTVGLSLRLADSGVVEAVDGTGEVVFHSPASMMWDSPRVPDPADPNLELEPGRTATMPVELTATELAVRPDLRMLADPESRYPVYLDPPFSRSPMSWTHVNSQAPNTSYEAAGNWSRDHMRVGRNWNANDVWRTHIRFNISAMIGQRLVGNPTFSIRLYHSASCNATPVQLWQTNTISAAGQITWNYMRNRWLHGAPLQERSANANKAGGCGTIQPTVTMEFSHSNIRNHIQRHMDSDFPTFTFGLRARNESDHYQWKKFLTSSARLTATYNLPPDRPANLALSGDCFGSCASPAILRADRPTLQARVTDPNGDAMMVRFEVHKADRSAVVASSGTSITNRTSGTTVTWRTPALPQNTQLHWRVRTRDVHNAWGPWSGWFTMLIDTTAPFSPTVHSDLYRHVSSGTWNGGVGVPGQFTFGFNHSYDVVAFEWRFVGGNVTRLPTSPGQTRTVSIAPAGDLLQQLQVRSIDHAGNTSGWATYSFRVRPQPVDVAYWRFDEASGGFARAAAGGDSYRGELHGGAGWAPSGLNPDDPAASGTAVSLPGGSWVEMPSVLETDHPAGWSVSAWVYLTDKSGYRSAVVQNSDQRSMFRLEYRAAQDAWCFTVRAGAAEGGGLRWACSSVPVVLNEWTFLVGVFDSPNQTMQLYVNGGPQSGEFPPGTVTELSAPAPWAANGAFTVGRRMSAPGEFTNHWHGRVDEVRAYQRVLTEGQISHMFLSCRYAECPSP